MIQHLLSCLSDSVDKLPFVSVMTSECNDLVMTLTLCVYRSEERKIKEILKVVDEVCARENITVFDKVTRRR